MPTVLPNRKKQDGGSDLMLIASFALSPLFILFLLLFYRDSCCSAADLPGFGTSHEPVFSRTGKPWNSRGKREAVEAAGDSFGGEDTYKTSLSVDLSAGD